MKRFKVSAISMNIFLISTYVMLLPLFSPLEAIPSFKVGNSFKSPEYIYPIALLSPNVIATIYQSSPQKIELIAIDSISQKITPLLSSRFMPTHIIALPDKSGFSFIDNGLIYKKLLYKRSPQLLEFTLPFYEINSMLWDDREHMIISAQQKNRYTLLYIDKDGNGLPLFPFQNADFLYPQKVGVNLFFISRSIDGPQRNYAISLCEFNDCDASNALNFNNDNSVNYKNAESFLPGNLSSNTNRHEYAQKTIADFGNQPIAFLAMEAEDQGYVVAHPSHIEGNKETSNDIGAISADTIFSYYSVYKNSGDDVLWHKKKLFDFAIPLEFLLKESNSVLYEYMNPLLPKKIDNYIYYSHAVNGNLNMYKYCLDSQTNTQITFSDQAHDHYFCPIKVHNVIYCGGTVRGKGDIKLHVIA